MKSKSSLYIISLTILTVSFTSCKSKKHLAKSSGSTFGQPSNKIASKYAEMMEVSKNDIKNGKLYEFIDDWEGTSYEFGGLDKHGVDCSGLVYLCYKDVYEKQIPRMTSQQVQIIKRKYENQLKEGDLVFFDYDGKRFSHVGIYLQNGYYVHASSSKGVILTRLHDPYTYKYFSRCGSVE